MMEREFQFIVEPECEFDDSFEGSKDNAYALEGKEEEDSEDSEGSEGSEGGKGGNEERVLKVRLDKWLWAARFFKTRALARAAVEAGKVFYDGERSKASREIELGATLQVRQGRFEKTVIVRGLSTRRRSTEEALQLFEETEISKNNRAQFEQEGSHSWRNDAYPSYSQQNKSYSHQNNAYVNQSPYSQPYAESHSSNSYYPEQRERRTTRFLRRSSMRQTTQQNRSERGNDFHEQKNDDYNYARQQQDYLKQQNAHTRQQYDYARQQQDSSE